MKMSISIACLKHYRRGLVIIVLIDSQELETSNGHSRPVSRRPDQIRHNLIVRLLCRHSTGRICGSFGSRLRTLHTGTIVRVSSWSRLENPIIDRYPVEALCPHGIYLQGTTRRHPTPIRAHHNCFATHPHHDYSKPPSSSDRRKVRGGGRRRGGWRMADFHSKSLTSTSDRPLKRSTCTIRCSNLTAS